MALTQRSYSFDEASFSPVAISRKKNPRGFKWLLWLVQCSNEWKKLKEQKISISQFSLFACPGYTCHELSVIKNKRPFWCIYVHRSCCKIQLTVQWRPERWCSYRVNLQVTQRNERVSLEMAGWNAFLLWPTNTKKLRNLRDPGLIALGLHAYVTGSNPVLTPGCEFYLLFSEIQLHHGL